MNRRNLWASLALAALSSYAARAEAQLWHPLSGKARPHMIVGFDTSVTMGIDSNCNDCHRDSPSITTRLDDAKVEIRRALPMFKNYFYYGGFEYAGCGAAHVVGTPILPSRTSPTTSFTQVMDMIRTARECGSKEAYLPGGASTGGITPNSANDRQVLLQILNGGINGLTIPQPGVPFPLSPVCTEGPNMGAQLDLGALLTAEFASTTWPRWEPDREPITGRMVQTQLCDPLQTGLNSVNTRLVQCLGATAAQAFWNAAGLSCSPGTIAGNVCSNGALLENTCVCNQLLPGCVQGNSSTPLCSEPLHFKARQQVGVCTSYMDDTYGDFFRADTDNITHRTANNPIPCRENVALFFTDGAFGDNPKIPIEASNALTDFYRSPTNDANGTPQSNMFLFHVSTQFGGDANAMARALGNPRYNASNQSDLLESFARIVNRVYRGSYVGANVTADRFGTRLAVHSFEVPSGPTSVGETYLGRPSRVAVYAIDGAGVPSSTPLYATDWQGRAPTAAVRTLCTGNATGGCALGNSADCGNRPERVIFGPLPPGNSNFRNGVARRQDTSAFPGESTQRTWGYMLGGSTTQPVIVDAPRDIPAGSSAAAYGAFATDARMRPRVIYVMSNTFLHAIHAGARVDNPPRNGRFDVTRLYDYDDATNPLAGTELFRFFPRRWLSNASVDSSVDLCLNDVVAQELITGQLAARDLQIAAGSFRTILAAAQGAKGRGLATLDVTDPSAPKLLAEWLMAQPNGQTVSASAQPELHQWAVNGAPRGALVTTSGLGSMSELRAYDVSSGALMASVVIPGTGDLPTEPACVDAVAKGAISHCYVLRRNGQLYRVPVGTNGGFGTPVDITPNDVVGAGRVFLTRPIVFFGDQGTVNIAFGSGNSLDFAPGSDSSANRFFKLVDAFNKSSTPVNQASLSDVCFYGGQLQDGIIELGDARVVSPPVIAKGVIAFTTYTPGSSGCAPGGALLYAMDYARCTDAYAVSPTVAPRSHLIHESGVPGSPVILRGAQTILTQTSQHTAGSLEGKSNLKTRGGDRVPFRKLYWRPRVQAQ